MFSPSFAYFSTKQCLLNKTTSKVVLLGRYKNEVKKMWGGGHRIWNSRKNSNEFPQNVCTIHSVRVQPEVVESLHLRVYEVTLKAHTLCCKPKWGEKRKYPGKNYFQRPEIFPFEWASCIFYLLTLKREVLWDDFKIAKAKNCMSLRYSIRCERKSLVNNLECGKVSTKLGYWNN